MGTDSKINILITSKRDGVTLFFACKREGGRAEQRPGESTRRTLTPMHGGKFTHPDHASLVDPLYASRKEGEKPILQSPWI